MLGHYCDTIQRINHKSKVIRCGIRYCQNLPTAQKNSLNSQKLTSNFKILYRKLRFGLLSRWNSLYRRNQRGTMRHAWYCHNSATVRETDMPVSTHLSQKQSRSENARITSLCMKQHIQNQLPHQHSYSLQPPRTSIHAREVNLVTKLLQYEVTQQSCINSKRHIKIPYWRNQTGTFFKRTFHRALPSVAQAA